MEENALYVHQWIALVAVFSLAVISPGPDFVLAVRNSLVFSRRTGVLTSIGFGLGILVHTTYTLLGIATLIASSIMVYTLIKYAGAAYLIYLGVNSLRSGGATNAVTECLVEPAKQDKYSISGWKALRSGFLTNVLNPKSTIFFLAVFSQIIRAETPIVWQIAYGMTCAVMVAGWFSLVAVVLTQEHIRSKFLGFAKWIDRTCGALMIALGLKVALMSK